MNKKLSITRNNEYVRVGDKDELIIPKYKSIYTKRERESYNRVVNIYNSKGEFVAIEVHKEDKDIIEVIHNSNTGITVVIIEDDNGSKIKGIAKCRKEDIYIPQTGYTIALNRAIVKRAENKLKELVK